MSLSEKSNGESQEPPADADTSLKRNESHDENDETYKTVPAAETNLMPNAGVNDSSGASAPEFVADVATFGNNEAAESEVYEDDVEYAAGEEELMEPETISISEDNTSDEAIERANSQSEGLSSPNSDSTGDTPSEDQDGDDGVSEVEAVDLDVPNGEHNRTDSDENRMEEALESEPAQVADDSTEQSNDPEVYEQVAALMSGMNREHIDWRAAQRIVSDDKSNDPILAGFHALLLHPEIYKDGRLFKSEVKSLRAWIRAQDLGLLDEVKAGNTWALWLKGMFLHVDCKDFASAKQYYELAAAQDNASALQNLGSLYMMGKGVRRDYKKAKEYFVKASEQGHAAGQCCLGLLYVEGKGVQQDYERGVHYFEIAASQGYVGAQYKLGSLYQEAKDYEKAKQYYELATAQGYQLAQCNLASMYVKGTGVAIDYERARHLYELAASQGCVSSQNNLGHLYKNGLGVRVDYEKAKEYYELATKQGFDTTAQSNLDNLSQESCVIS